MSEVETKKSKFGCLPILLISVVLIVGLTIYVDHEQQQLATLKADDPIAYVEELKARGDEKYWSELEALFPERYSSEVKALRAAIIEDGRARALDYVITFYEMLIEGSNNGLQSSRVAAREKALLVEKTAEHYRTIEIAKSVIPRGDFDELIEVGVLITALNYCDDVIGYPEIDFETAKLAISDITSSNDAYAKRIGAEGLAGNILTGATDVTAEDPLGIKGAGKSKNCAKYLPFVLTSDLRGRLTK